MLSLYFLSKQARKRCSRNFFPSCTRTRNVSSAVSGTVRGRASSRVSRWLSPSAQPDPVPSPPSPRLSRPSPSSPFPASSPPSRPRCGLQWRDETLRYRRSGGKREAGKGREGGRDGGRRRRTMPPPPLPIHRAPLLSPVTPRRTGDGPVRTEQRRRRPWPDKGEAAAPGGSARASRRLGMTPSVSRMASVPLHCPAAAAAAARCSPFAARRCAVRARPPSEGESLLLAPAGRSRWRRVPRWPPRWQSAGPSWRRLTAGSDVTLFINVVAGVSVSPVCWIAGAASRRFGWRLRIIVPLTFRKIPLRRKW